jgi:hypothetical protein
MAARQQSAGVVEVSVDVVMSIVTDCDERVQRP